MSGKFRPLRADEIDCRVQSVKQNGLVLLLYKDARADQNILDETVGPYNWQRHHSRDNANCTVSIWDDEKKQWVGKEDTGTESNTEAQKGLASDSFKRACVNWGIGRELYSAPFTWISSTNCNIKQQGQKYACYDRFYVKDIGYDAAGNITKLVIVNDTLNRECFWYGPKPSQQPSTPQKTTPKPYNAQPITCERCGHEVVSTPGKGGKTLTPGEVVAVSRKRFGGATYCAECQKKLMEAQKAHAGN